MTSKKEKIVRVGSRKSELALIQTKHVIARLQKLYPNRQFEIHTMSTIGDRVLNISLPKIGEKSLFTRDLEDSLRSGGVDFVVHSLKDLPTALPIGMAIGAVLEREDARDALVLRQDHAEYTIQTLPKGSVIGTSSLRRTAQIRRLYPHLKVCDIRGNLNTRLAKLDAPDSKFTGIILAQAGLVRMGWMNRITQVLEPSDLLYAVGQGALAVECRANDNEILSMLQKLMCLSTTCRILAERSFLKTLGGGCSAPVAVCSKLNAFASNSNNVQAGLSLIGAVWSLDGAVEIRDKISCSFVQVEIIGDNNIVGLKVDENSNDQPPAKRLRNDNKSPDSVNRHSPTVINDDADVVEGFSTSFDVEELIKKHMDLAKKCPHIDGMAHNANTNGNIFNLGDGDANNLLNIDHHCPMHIDVGQDFMGQCPFYNSESKVFTDGHIIIKNVDETDRVAASTSTSTSTLTSTATSKCPFSALHNTNVKGQKSERSNSIDISHSKCPFLQKAVQMFDYADDEKPASNHIPILLEDVDNLFCGMYQHKCYSRELFMQSNNLGQQLAEELIKKGALDVMKCAQAEIHSKA